MHPKRFDVHQHITNQIVAAIEQGAGEFRLPWHRSASNIMRPVNIASKAAYRGVNILSLWASADANGYESGLWGSFKQWKDTGAQVRKGEKASYVVFYRRIILGSDNETEDGTGTRMFARATPVFAAEQVDGYAQPIAEAPKEAVETIDDAEAFIVATGARIEHGGSRAFYRPSTDSIHLPPRGSFVGTATSSPQESYYSTLLHELTHWTSAETRCNRQLGRRFGDDAYAMEELIAELGATFLCADLQISDSPRADHAQYFENWLRVLKADKKAIFTAASKASRAIDCINELQVRV
jgi:antirestriction protein ArdC